eukprot:TRINITY_DN54108_c0_g1_i2.p2 TRINITY_DN54108_c0_g1~~TRINITY_DN54108_c0_g1_i2.p2  ORF type:complete len:111 (+),score=9.67 TRINITY_DN54108_c0_g1_i2:163-495(+)
MCIRDRNKALLKDMSRTAFYSKDVISYIEGNWIDYVMIDGDNYWEIEMPLPYPLTKKESPLPSDCRYREDLVALITSTEEESQKEKDRLEELQRNDRKLREKSKKQQFPQ